MRGMNKGDEKCINMKNEYKMKKWLMKGCVKNVMAQLRVGWVNHEVCCDNKRNMKMTMGDELVKKDEVTMRWWWWCVGVRSDDDEVVMVTSALCSKCTLCEMRERKDERERWMKMMKARSENARWRNFAFYEGEKWKVMRWKTRVMRWRFIWDEKWSLLIWWQEWDWLMVVRAECDVW
jgi:hypothetical protein